jgi:predicted transcriptional regulator
MQDTVTIRIDATLKQKAEKKAAEQDETVSQVVRRALRDYVSARGSHAGYKPATKARVKPESR